MFYEKDITHKNWINRLTPYKGNNFSCLKNKILALLFPALLATYGWTTISCEDNKEQDVAQNMDCNSECWIIFSNEWDIKNHFINQEILDVPLELPQSTAENIFFYTPREISSISTDEIQNHAPWNSFKWDIKEYLYANTFKKLSKDNYDSMFTWLKDSAQGAVGNCYAIVAIKNIARSRFFDTLMMTSIEKSGNNSYNVYLPFWEPHWEKISINEKDLKKTKIKWSIWYKILEAAFSKYLLYKKWAIWDSETILTDELLQRTAGWCPWCAMQTLLWPKSYDSKCIKNRKENISKILNSLLMYNPQNLSTISAVTITADNKSDENSFIVEWQTLYYNHAYSVCKVGRDWDSVKYVILENPRNSNTKKWWKFIKLTFDWFLNAISSVDVWHITSNFLNCNTTIDELQVIDTKDCR